MADTAHQGADVVTFLHQAALSYARNDVAIFPCQPSGKQPATPSGFKDATTNLDQINLWWTDQPDANIGVALGASNVWILDVDGPQAQTALDELVDQHGPLPDTYTITTGRGQHIMFRQPTQGDRVRNRKLAAGGKLETRGDGGYAIAPPSIHPNGSRYTANGKWDNIANPPDWLITLTRQTPTRQAISNNITRYHDDSTSMRALRGAAGAVALAAKNHRNDTLFWAACRAGSMIAGGQPIDEQHARQLLTTAALRAGLEQQETIKTIQSGLDTGANDPEYLSDVPMAPTQVAPPNTNGHTPTAADGHTQPARSPLELPAAVTDLDPADPFHRAIWEEYTRRRAREAAVMLETAETSPDPPPFTRLDNMLARPLPNITYRIVGLWPTHGRVLLAAQFKAGKSTMVGNLLRTLVDGKPFLGSHPVQPLDQDRTVALIDDELHDHTLQRWLTDQQIEHQTQVHVVPLRGKTSTFNILDPYVRQQWAAKIAATGAQVIIFDCLRPILDSCGLSEDKDAGRFLVAFDELCELANVTEALVVHHMGHDGERSRGDSRLRDWPDVEWKIVRDGEAGHDDPAATRYFSAYGRDVDESERRLDYDETTRTLTLSGGDRKSEKAKGEALTVVARLQAAGRPLSFNQLKATLGYGVPKSKRVIAAAVAAGWVDVQHVGGTDIHSLTDEGEIA